MKNLKEISSMEEVRKIIAEEEKKAATIPDYLPSVHLTLLNVAEKANMYSILRDELFLRQERENINLLESKIRKFYKKDGIKYREDLEGNHLSSLRHLIKSTDITFEQAYNEAQKIMYELPDEIFTLTYLFQYLERKICSLQSDFFAQS